MIGIYKITNKLNGKIYIGQSINIKRRWNEHKAKKGEKANLLYFDFQKYGIENFDFSILQECEQSELDFLEIFYIKKFNSFYNGYNLTQGGQYVKNYQRFELKQEIKKEISFQKKLTDKQWLVYYYLMSICKWNGKDNERHYFVYKNTFNISAASRLLTISRPTFYKALENLKKLGIVIEEDKWYIIEIPQIYAAVDQKIIAFLLQFQKYLGVELIRTYVILNRIFQHQELDQWFNKATIIAILDHNISDASYYPQIELYLGFLSYWELIELKTEIRNENTGKHKYYKVISINTVSKINDFIIDTTAPVNKEFVEKIKKEILQN